MNNISKIKNKDELNDNINKIIRICSVKFELIQKAAGFSVPLSIHYRITIQ